MSVRNFFSGIESDQHFQACVDAGAKHVLTSFLYLQKRNDFDIVKKRKAKYPHLQFFIDSGAHSIQVDAARYSSWTLKDYEQYLKAYTKWLRANKEYIFCAVELDIDYNVGTPIVESWQKNYFLPLAEEGIDIIYVWHKERKLEGWEEMCSKFSYVGLPGEMSSEPDFNKYMTVARRYTTKVHGFAATKQVDFSDWPWYSVDSTTWKSSERYGVLLHWDKHTHKFLTDDDKSARAKYRRYFEEHGLDADGIINDTNYKEVTKYALISMRAMEEYYEQRFKDRIFYYDLRLPHPKVIASWSKQQLLDTWRLFRPDQVFKQHCNSPTAQDVRGYLTGISCVQNKLDGLLKASTASYNFLAAYFPKLTQPALVSDMQIFQKEMASFIAPPNPPPLPRTEQAHYLPSNNVPKGRSVVYSDADLDHDYTGLSFDL